MADVAAEAVVVCKHCSGEVYLATWVAVEAAAGAEADSVAEASAAVVAVVDLAAVLAEAATLVAEVREAVGNIKTEAEIWLRL